MDKPAPIPVLVTVEAGTFPGFAEAWRDERVYVRYSSSPGMQHLHWVDASQVTRRDA